MMIAIAMLSITLGFLLGYSVGFNKCKNRFKKTLETVIDNFDQNARDLDAEVLAQVKNDIECE